MDVRAAGPGDIGGFLELAAEAELWFGAMTSNPQFHAALDRNIRRGTAWVVRASDDAGLWGGLLTGGDAPVYRLSWLVVATPVRSRGVGRALVGHALGRFRRPCQVDVVTLGPDHPAAAASGGRVFYDRLGFCPGEPASPGPEGGTRQWYHLTLAP